MRTHEKTHPWINFELDLRRAPASLWVMLGECQSRCEHIAGVSLRPETGDRLYQMYLAKGALATTAIEGNTLSEQQVRKLLDHELELPRSQEYLKREVENIVAVCNLLLEQIKAGESLRLNRGVIQEFNRQVLNKLALDDGVNPGEVRKYGVGVARYRGAPAEDCVYLLDRLCAWLDSETFKAPRGLTTVYATIKAVVAHLYLAWIHLFGDGNGRTARLMEFQILITSGVPAPAAHLLSNHYNQTRAEYYRQLEWASRSEDGVVSFLHYAVQGFLDGLREQLHVIGAQQLDVAWRNYVHEFFKDKKSPSNQRRRRLVLDLSRVDHPVPLDGLPEVSARLAREYARRTPKTLSRDVNVLVESGLIEKTIAGYRARKDIIRAFLPERADRERKG